MRDRARRCPSCRRVVDGATSADGRDLVPRAGDVTVCLYCGELAVFTADDLRRPTVEELAVFLTDEDVRRVVAVVRMYQASRARLQ